MRPIIPDTALISKMHDLTVSRDGGATGLRDAGLLASAWGRAEAAIHYGTPDAVDLAVTLAHGILQNHPFVDGNKRSAYATLNLTLEMNGLRLSFEDFDLADMMLAAASGSGIAAAGALHDEVRPAVTENPVYARLFDLDSEGPGPG